MVSRRGRGDRHMRADGTALAAAIFRAHPLRVLPSLVIMSAEKLAVGDRVGCPKCRRWHPAMQPSSGSMTDYADRAHAVHHMREEQSRLTDAIAAGADVPILVERLRGTEERRRQLAGEL